MITLQEIPLDLRKRSTEELELRAGRAIAHLAEAVGQEYNDTKEISVKSAGGAASAFTSSVSVARGLLVAVLGVSKANAYVKYLEYGVKPYAGAEFPAFTKPPPTAAILKWLRKGKIAIPGDSDTKQLKKILRRNKLAREKHKVDRQKELTSFAFAIAMNLKKRGRPALRIIEKTALKELANINKILQGA